MAAVVEDDESPDREDRDDERTDRAERPGHGNRPVGEDPAGRQPGSRRRHLHRAPPGRPLELLEYVSLDYDAHRDPPERCVPFDGDQPNYGRTIPADTGREGDGPQRARPRGPGRGHTLTRMARGMTSNVAGVVPRISPSASISMAGWASIRTRPARSSAMLRCGRCV